MFFKKIAQFILLTELLTICFISIGCASGKSKDNAVINTNDNKPTVNTSANKLVSDTNSNSSGFVNQVNLYTLNYGQSESQITCNDNICITLNHIPSAIYQDNLWVQEFYPTTINVTFKTDINNFLINDIYNELDPNTQQIVGKISQINTQDCDSLISSGATSGKSCNIYLNYRGIAKDEQLNNMIHINFLVNDTNFPFVFKVINKSTGNNSKWPVLDSSNESSLKVISLLPTKNDSGIITYSRSIFNQFSFVNQGEFLKMNDDSTPTLTISFADALTVNGNNILQFTYYLNPLQTSCGNGNISPQQACSVPLLMQLAQQDNFVSYINNYVVNYSFENNNHQQSVYSAHPFVVSPGALIAKNYQLNTKNNESGIIIEKASLGVTGINYSIPLSNFKLYAKYNPSFYIDTIMADKQLLYAYGSRYEQLITNQSIKFDSKCFTDEYNPDYDGYEFTGRRGCVVNFENRPTIKMKVNGTSYQMPLGFDLYAEYDSVTENKHVVQYIGHVSYADNQITINGTYTNAFSNIKVENGSLSADFTGGNINNHDSLEYNATCEDFSDVNYFVSDEGNPRSPSSTDPTIRLHRGYLTCDKLNSQFPQGDYKNSCTTLYLDNGVLHAKCLGKTRFGGINDYTIKPLTTSLDYLHQCKAGATIQNNNGKLEC
jgi:hypothetical protein